MSQVFSYKTLALAVATLGIGMSANAAGLDRSGQDITPFLQDGTYAEISYTYLDAKVSGHDNGATSGASDEASYVKGKATGDIAESYDFGRFAVKADINDRFSIGVLYDEPFGAAVQHSGDSNFNTAGADATYAALLAGTAIQSIPRAATSLAVNADGSVNQAGLATAVTAITPSIKAKIVANLKASDPTLSDAQATAMAAAVAPEKAREAIIAALPANRVANNAKTQKGQGTNVEIRTQNVTPLIGMKLGANNNFQVYAGPAFQRLTGEVHLRGIAYQGANGYDARINTDYTTGWVAGVAYSKPEIALKAALTYRSETEHESTISEVFPPLGNAGVTTQAFKVSLPESWNLDFQTGVSPTMLLSAKVRYVPWNDFNIKPTLYTKAANTPIVFYAKDQWSADLGLGKKLSDKLAVSGSVGYDSGAGNPVSTLGPIKGYYSLGLGAKYNVTPEWSVSVGGKYIKFGDATARLPRDKDYVAGKFEDNDGYAVGVKLAYHAK